MKRCAACNELILWGGTEHRGKRYCKEECLDWGKSQDFADDIPQKIVNRWAAHLRNAPCPICKGPGPNDVHHSQRMVGVFLVAESTDTSVFGCRNCGNQANLQATMTTALAGWWWLPWGPLATPFIVVTNLISMLHRVPNQPSPLLVEMARHDLGERRRVCAEADVQPTFKDLETEDEIVMAEVVHEA